MHKPQPYGEEYFSISLIVLFHVFSIVGRVGVRRNKSGVAALLVSAGTRDM